MISDPSAQFVLWQQQTGARHVLTDLYRMAAPYARRYHRTGQRVSVRLLWERERDRIKEVRARLIRRGCDLAKWGGYRLNNNLTAQIARHIVYRRPEWNGMFELRGGIEDVGSTEYQDQEFPINAGLEPRGNRVGSKPLLADSQEDK